MRSRVDLPQPEGPTSTVNEPSAMSMSTPCSTAVSPKLFLTDWIVTLAICSLGGGGSRPGGQSMAGGGARAMRANR